MLLTAAPIHVGCPPCGELKTLNFKGTFTSPLHNFSDLILNTANDGLGELAKDTSDLYTAEKFSFPPA